MQYISKNELKKYKKLLLKKYRDQNKQFIIEGLHLVNEAINSNLLDLIICSNEQMKFKFDNVKYCTYEEIKLLSSTKSPQQVVGICKYKQINRIKNNLVVLNKINDPGNLGTIIRNAYAFNFSDVIVEGVDIYNPKVIRATQGAIFYINVFNVDNLEQYLKKIKQNDYQLIGSLLDKKAKDYNNFQPNNKFALIFGNEAHGIEENIIKLLNQSIYIPIQFESLNVASAAAIFLSKYNKLKR